MTPKSLCTIIAVVGFAGLMLFGAFLMVHPAGSHANCLPALMGTNECAMNINPLAYARVHLGALAELTRALPLFRIFGTLAAFAILMVLLYAAGAAKAHRPLFALQSYGAFSRDRARNLVVRKKFFKWAALHEKRDPSLACAARA